MPSSLIFVMMAFFIFLPVLTGKAAILVTVKAQVNMSNNHLETWPDPDTVVCSDLSVAAVIRSALVSIEQPNPKNPPPTAYQVGTLQNGLAPFLLSHSLKIPPSGIGALNSGELQITLESAQLPLACRVISRMLGQQGLTPFQCTLGDLAINASVRSEARAAGASPEIFELTDDEKNIRIAFVATGVGNWTVLRTGTAVDIAKIAQLSALPLACVTDIEKLGFGDAMNYSSQGILMQQLPEAESLANNFYFNLVASPPKPTSLDSWPNNAAPTYELLDLVNIDPPSGADAQVTQFYYGSTTLNPVSQLQSVVDSADLPRVKKEMDDTAAAVSATAQSYLPSGKFVTQDQIDKMMLRIGAQPHVAGTQINVTNDQVTIGLTYEPTTYDVKASASYGSPSGFQPSLTFDSKNLNFAGDEVTASASGGPDGYHVSSSYQAVVWRSLNRAWNLGIGPHGGYDQLSKIHLDNPDGPYLHQDTALAGGQVTLAFDSANEILHTNSGTSSTMSATSPASHRVVGSIGLDTYFRAEWVRGPSIYLGSQTQVESPCAALKGAWAEQDTLGAANAIWGESDLALTGNVTALGQDNGDAIYYRGDAASTETLYFGWKSPKDFLARGIIGGGQVAGRVPRFDYYSLGGDQIDRGLLSGDVIGRGILYETVEFGVSLGFWLDPKMVASIKSSGFDLSAIYLKALIDHGDAWGRPSLPGIRTLSSDSTTYGGGLEYDQVASGHPLALFLGYAWSPQTDRDGRFVTQVSVQF